MIDEPKPCEQCWQGPDGDNHFAWGGPEKVRRDPGDRFPIMRGSHPYVAPGECLPFSPNDDYCTTHRTSVFNCVHRKDAALAAQRSRADELYDETARTYIELLGVQGKRDSLRALVREVIDWGEHPERSEGNDGEDNAFPSGWFERARRALGSEPKEGCP